MPTTDDQYGMFFKGDGIMQAIGQYLLTITSAAIICAILRRLLDKKNAPDVMGKLLIGLFMTYTVLSPLMGLSFGSMDGMIDSYQKEAQEAVNVGEKEMAQALHQSIKTEVEAYVLEKAQDLGAQVRVTATLTDELYPVPKSITIRGAIDPLAKNRLKQIIADDLGVGEENQIWI